MMERVRVYLGFPDRISFVSWSLTSAACVLLALIRTPLFSDEGMKSFSPPGEAFNMREVRPAFIAHLALIIIWCFLGVLQFAPIVRKSLSFAYHRAAGRVFLCVSVGVAISGLSMATRAFGGPFLGQVGMFVLSLCFLIAAFNGYWSIRVKNIPAHRDWMIRLFAYGTSVITVRIFIPLGLLLSPRLGLHTTSKCDLIAALIGNLLTSQKFPACGSPTKISGETVVVIYGSFETKAHAAASIQIGYQAGVLLALLIHATCAEAWIRTRYYSRKEVEQEATQGETGTALKSNSNQEAIGFSTARCDEEEDEQQQKSYLSTSKSDSKIIFES